MQEEQEAIKPVVETQLDFEKHKDAIFKHLADSGLSVLTAKQKQDEIDAVVKSTHTDWEAKLSEALGEAKPDGIKGIDWAVSKIKPKPQVEDPKPEPASTIAGDIEKQTISNLEKRLEELIKSNETEKATSRSKTINLGVKAVTRSLNFNVDEAEEAVKRQKSIETLISNNYRIDLNEDNELVAYKGDEIVLDVKTNKPMSLESIAKEDWPFMFNAEKKPVTTGTGTKYDEVKINTEGKTYYHVTTEPQLLQKLRDNKVVAGSKEWQSIYDASIIANRLKV